MVHLRGHLEIVIIEAKNLQSRSVVNPYCIVELVGTKSTHEIGKTNVIEDHYNPKWLSTVSTDIDQDVIEIRFIVKDRSLFKDEKLGSSVLDTSNLGTNTQNVTMDLSNKKQTNSGQLFVKVKFKPLEDDEAATAKGSAKLHKGCISRKTEGEPLLPTKFLHGSLIVSVKNAENLPNTDSSLLNRKNKSDPFAVVGIQDAFGEIHKLARTETVDNNLSPEWNEKFTIDVCHDIANVVFVVYDEDVVKHDKMCAAEIRIEDVESGKVFSGTIPLFKHRTKEAGKITVSVQYLKKSNVTLFEVNSCVFPVRNENNVKLYQDAVCPSLPLHMKGHSGQVYSIQNAWHDISITLSNAKKFICITGWSLNTSIILVRTECGSGDSIGKILLDRAEAGVDVRVLLWDEADSCDAKKDTAKEFFKESLVKVDLVTRKKQRKESFNREYVSSKFCFSHNQKCIVADQSVEGSPGLRNVVAYVGCFDLTSGRYDTPEHRIDNSGDGDQKSQFYNSLIATITKSHSRNPWHDVMCKIVGPAALDVYTNFQSRWEMDAQVAESDYDMTKPNGLYLGYGFEALDSWDVQVFRSTTEESVPLDASENVFTYAGMRVENSLQRAYIHHIRRSKQFLYMETTNFIGSSHFWEECRDIVCKNLIPIEICTKIVEKINEGRLYTAYIVMSMHPEGCPEDMIAQEVLHWQYHTIEMMYRRIGRAIEEKGLDTHPQDYLLFLCLGKREECFSAPKLLKQLSEDGPLPSLLKQKRSIIAVNSKLAIFDDEYILVGSGNINDRSMAGDRNTELAIGASQPRVGAVGKVSTFRKCLWAEHLGASAPIDFDPNNLHCVRKVRQMAENTLKCYVDNSMRVPESHLMMYPLHVHKRGAVSSLHYFDKFPDTKAHVVGARSKMLPSALTT